MPSGTNKDKLFLALKIFCIIAGLAIVVFSSLIIARYVIGSAYVELAGEDGTDDVPKFLLDMNWPESQVVYYNQGNAAYHRGEYEDARLYYEKALASSNKKAPQDCDIRVNLALSVCAMIEIPSDGVAGMDDAAKVKAITQLVEASDALCGNGCAEAGRIVEQARVVAQTGDLTSAQTDYSSDVSEGEEKTGHDADAQQLEYDIEALLKELLNPPIDQQQQQQQQPEQQQQPQDPQQDQQQQQDQQNQDQQNQDQQQPDQSDQNKDQGNQGQDENQQDGQDENDEQKEQRQQEQRDELMDRRHDAYEEKEGQAQMWGQYDGPFTFGYNGKRW